MRMPRIERHDGHEGPDDEEDALLVGQSRCGSTAPSSPVASLGCHRALVPSGECSSPPTCAALRPPVGAALCPRCTADLRAGRRRCPPRSGSTAGPRSCATTTPPARLLTGLKNRQRRDLVGWLADGLVGAARAAPARRSSRGHPPAPPPPGPGLRPGRAARPGPGPPVGPAVLCLLRRLPGPAQAGRTGADRRANPGFRAAPSGSPGGGRGGRRRHHRSHPHRRRPGPARGRGATRSRRRGRPSRAGWPGDVGCLHRRTPEVRNEWTSPSAPGTSTSHLLCERRPKRSSAASVVLGATSNGRRCTSSRSATRASPPREVCDVMVEGRGRRLRAKAAAADAFAAVDLVVGKLEHQLHSLKTKVVARNRSDARQRGPDRRHGSTTERPACGYARRWRRRRTQPRPRTTPSAS